MDDREYELKKSDLALKEREVAVKENEGKTSQWRNPLTIAILVAAFGLFGNIATNLLSNHASAEDEHIRAQSNLISEVIRTNGKTEDTCTNLNFVVRLGLLDDVNGTIQKVCGEKTGVPNLPFNSAVSGSAGGVGNLGLGVPSWSGVQPFGSAETLDVRVEDAYSHQPLENARVVLNGFVGGFLSFFTGATGIARLNFVSSYDSVTVSKDGYETVKMPLTELAVVTATSITIDLHRATSKH